MRIAVTGSSGLIGTAVRESLDARGHDVVRVLRGVEADPSALWDPAAGWFREGALDGIDAVIHLAGEDISAKRWTEGRRRDLRRSRVDATRLLVEQIGAATPRPGVLISASAVGYYGDGQDRELTEDAAAGEGFLAALCAEWESEARHVEELGVRAVQLRFGVVLSERGGALRRMLTPFRLGAGGRLGSGRQWFSWVSLADAAGAVMHTLESESLSGPVNVTAPAPLTNAQFTRALGRALRRPAVLPLPAAALRLLFGHMADETLLVSQRVLPSRLLESGYQFQHEEVGGALEAALNG